MGSIDVCMISLDQVANAFTSRKSIEDKRELKVVSTRDADQKYRTYFNFVADNDNNKDLTIFPNKCDKNLPPAVPSKMDDS